MKFYIIGAEKVIIYGDQDYPPYTFAESGELKGIYVDLLKAVDKNIKEFEIVFEPMPWARAVKMIESGQAEAIIDAWYRPVERPYMSYSVPMLNEEIVVVTIEGKGKTWPKDFLNEKIGINRGFAVFKENDKKLITIEEANSTADNILKLITGRVAYYANDRYSIFWEILSMVNKKEISLKDANRIKVSAVLSKEDGYIGYRKVSNWPKKELFMKLVDKEIEKMKKNGELENIVKKYTGN